MAESFDRFCGEVLVPRRANRLRACRRARGGGGSMRVASCLQVITRSVSVDQMLCGIDSFRLSRREWTIGDIAITDPTGIRAFGRGSWM